MEIKAVKLYGNGFMTQPVACILPTALTKILTSAKKLRRAFITFSCLVTRRATVL